MTRQFSAAHIARGMASLTDYASVSVDFGKPIYDHGALIGDILNGRNGLSLGRSPGLFIPYNDTTGANGMWEQFTGIDMPVVGAALKGGGIRSCLHANTTLVGPQIKPHATGYNMFMSLDNFALDGGKLEGRTDATGHGIDMRLSKNDYTTKSRFSSTDPRNSVSNMHILNVPAAGIIQEGRGETSFIGNKVTNCGTYGYIGSAYDLLFAGNFWGNCGLNGVKFYKGANTAAAQIVMVDDKSWFSGVNFNTDGWKVGKTLLKTIWPAATIDACNDWQLREYEYAYIFGGTIGGFTSAAHGGPGAGGAWYGQMSDYAAYWIECNDSELAISAQDATGPSMHLGGKKNRIQFKGGQGSDRQMRWYSRQSHIYMAGGATGQPRAEENHIRAMIYEEDNPTAYGLVEYYTGAGSVPIYNQLFVENWPVARPLLPSSIGVLPHAQGDQGYGTVYTSAVPIRGTKHSSNTVSLYPGTAYANVL